MKIPGKLPIGTIRKKLPTLTSDQLTQLNDSISLAPSAVVAVDTKKIASPIVEKTFSMRLKKWVEPYSIGGVEYSLFYTEVDHNFKVGDRAFIEGGVYDSDAYIQKNKYKRNVDGYKVLYVDRCKIVLDIKYTGGYPTNEEPIDNFVKVYVANTQEEFDYFSQTLSMRNDSNILDFRFKQGFNNFLFLNGTFSIVPGTFNNLQYFISASTLVTSLTASNSFVVRGNKLANNVYWTINDYVQNNLFQTFLNPSYASQSSIFYNNEKLRIMNGNFSFGGVDFKNEYVYYYDTTDNIWKIDKSYLPTIITEQHFKRGIFKKGSYNQGLYGQHGDRIKYNGDQIKWNLGSTLNVDWESGVLDSTIFKDDSSFTIFDRYELPQIRANAANNGGAGYNYIFNTNFTGGDVINGNIFNMAVVLGTTSATQSVLEDYLLGNQTMNYSINLKGGVYYNSDILFASVSNSTLISSYAFNSMLNHVKSVNSEIENSVFINGTWISDKIVKIQSYEESNITWYDKNTQIPYKMYKFYVTDTNWARLREFQNFYFQDLGINIPSTELLNFFDDKFSVGSYLRSTDTIGGKFTQSVLIQLSTKEENRNSPGVISLGGTVSMQLNDNALPSIDIFIQGGQDFNYGTSSSYPRPFIGDTIDISKAYILDSDFVSGLFKDSRWVSGNYFNYNADYSLLSYKTTNDGYVTNYDSVTKELSFFSFYPKYRTDILGTQSEVQNITWINGLYYDSNLNGGSNIVKLSDTYKINRVGTFSVLGREFFLQDLFTQSGNSSLTTWSNQQYIRTINAQNRWNYLHPVKFENSVINSGIFRRAYFQNCDFINNEFDSTDRELSDAQNKRKLLLSDIIFADNSNEINSGLVQYSHFVGGSDTWNNGIFHSGIWNTEVFTYSSTATSSIIYNSGGNNFKNGIFRNSRWVNGTFDNGLFYKNNTNSGGTSSTFLDTLDAYYIDNTNPLYFLRSRWSWQNGTFKNGDFEKSNFESGKFINGNFYDSNFLTGEATGGNFGKTNLNYSKTRVYTGTFSNVSVINAEFRAENPRGGIPTFYIGSPTYTIVWKSGLFNKGVFGVKMIGPYILCYPYLSTWEDGIFNNGEFTDTAIWYNGIFNDGKFTSRFGLFDTIVGGYVSPHTFRSLPTSYFAWQDGKFNGGEFGTGQLGLTNSTWYTGEFNGGKFKGKYWRNGIFTRGQFEGSATTSTDAVLSTQSYAPNYIDFYKSFNKYFYGYWEDGYVSKNKDKFITDEKLWTDLERTSTYKKKKPDTLFKNVFWNAGTFSNFDAQMDNSFWLNGSFQDGYFNNSVFNPYLNLYKLPPIVLSKNGQDYYYISNNQSLYQIEDNYYYYFVAPGSNSFIHNDILQIGETYSVKTFVMSNSGVSISVNGNIVVTSGFTGLVNYSFNASSVNLTVTYQSLGSATLIRYSPLSIYPGTQSGFRITDTCIWENGQAYSSDFYFSKWKQGVFDSHSTSSQGNMWGNIWQDGIVKYMNANNVYWENGIWKNGNWNGSPFKANYLTPASYGLLSNLKVSAPGFDTDIMSNIYLYASQSYTNDSNNLISIHENYDLLHMNDVFDVSGNYDAIYNNENVSTLMAPFFFTNLFGFGTQLYLPNTVTYSVIQTNDPTKKVRTRFGNGRFLSGIWENGVWNEGWRNDDIHIIASDLNKFTSGKNLSYQIDVWTWEFELQIVNDGILSISVGDKVSIGNIAAIDINNRRRLYRGTYDVIGVDLNNYTIRVTLNINFPIRGIVKDSDNHLIYISKKSWLNGIFLNGYFGSGVWNNGYFSGYPYITKMEDTHWIDGTFRGGRFRGLTSSLVSNTGVTYSYHTGVIQKFNYYDENVSGQPFIFKYNSWIDVNYYKTEGVNINKYNRVYKTTPFGFTSSYYENNYYGYPTVDVLESVSTLRNSFNLNSRKYSLGWKWTEYTDFLDGYGVFNDINELHWVNNKNATPLLTDYGIQNFYDAGWTFSWLSNGASGMGFATASNAIVSNIGNIQPSILYLYGGNVNAPEYPYDDNKNFTVDFYDNVYTHDIEPRRYNYIEITGRDLSQPQNKPLLFYNNYPATHSFAGNPILFNGNLVLAPVNQAATTSFIQQREYFFNKPDLFMTIFNGATYGLKFSNFKFVETDMIPFFQFTSDCIQQKDFTTWDTTPPIGPNNHPQTPSPGANSPGTWGYAKPNPLVATASGSPLVGNLTTLDEPPTWGNFYLVNAQQGTGCVSNINSDIVEPISATAVDLTYGDSDLISAESGPELPPGIATDEPPSTDIDGVLPDNNWLTPPVNLGQIYNITIIANGPGTTLPAAGSYTQIYGSTLTVQANPTLGNYFAGWTVNGVVSPITSQTITLTITGDVTVQADFTNISPNLYQVVTSASPIIGGTTSGDGSYYGNSSVTVVATPDDGYGFINWTENGLQQSTNASYTFNITSNKNLVANFVSNLSVFATASIPVGNSVNGHSYTSGYPTTIGNQPFIIFPQFQSSTPIQIDSYSGTFKIDNNTNLGDSDSQTMNNGTCFLLGYSTTTPQILQQPSIYYWTIIESRNFNFRFKSRGIATNIVSNSWPYVVFATLDTTTGMLTGFDWRVANSYSGNIWEVDYTATRNCQIGDKICAYMMYANWGSNSVYINGSIETIFTIEPQ